MAFLIFFYLIVVTVAVFWIGKRVKTSEDYFLAGRSLPWYIVGGGLISTGIGGATCIGYPGSYYTLGLDWFCMAIGSIIAMLIIVFFVAEKVRKMGIYTVPEMLSRRYDNATRVAAALLIIVGDIALVCTQILAFSGALSGYIGVNQDVGGIIGTVVFILTSLGGGLIGVAITDAIQAVFLLGGIFIVAVLVFIKTKGFSLWPNLPVQYFSPFKSLSVTTVIGNVLALMGTFLASQSTFFSRINAAATPKDAKKATILHLISVALVLGVCMPIIGYSAYLILGPGVKANNVMSSIISSVLPPWAGSLYVAVIVGAILTSVNTIILSVSMNVVKDLLESTFFKDKITEKQLLWLGKFTTVAIGVLAYLLTKTMPNIITAIVFAYTMSSIMVVPIYGGMLWRRPGAIGGFLSIVLGGSATLIWQFVLKMPWGLHSIIPGYIFAFIGLALGCLQKPISEDRWQTFHGNKDISA